MMKTFEYLLIMLTISFIVIYEWGTRNNEMRNVDNHHKSMDSYLSIVLLSNSVFSIILSNQFLISIEQILLQTIIWELLVDWNQGLCECSICDR